MPRNIRIEYPGAFYHVMARGNRRGEIFLEDEDRNVFLQTLGGACQMTGWRVHAWVLMDNHYHLLIETPEGNLVAGMKWLQNTYTRRFNSRNRKWGRLFGDRYKAVLVEADAGNYFSALCDYIHLNPIRAGMVHLDRGQSLLDYPWSSIARGYAILPKHRAPWIEVADGLGAAGLPDDTAGRRAYVRHLEERGREERRKECGVPEAPEDGRLSHLRRGWYWGSQAFAEKLLKMAQGALSKAGNRNYRSGSLRKAHDESAAIELLRNGLKQHGLRESELEALPGSARRKVEIARSIWEQTDVSQGWIAERLRMRSAANVSQQLRRGGRLSRYVD